MKNHIKKYFNEVFSFRKLFWPKFVDARNVCPDCYKRDIYFHCVN